MCIGQRLSVGHTTTQLNPPACFCTVPCPAHPSPTPHPTSFAYCPTLLPSFTLKPRRPLGTGMPWKAARARCPALREPVGPALQTLMLCCNHNCTRLTVDTRPCHPTHMHSEPIKLVCFSIPMCTLLVQMLLHAQGIFRPSRSRTSKASPISSHVCPACKVADQ